MAVLLMMSLLGANDGPLPKGDGEFTVTAYGEQVQVFTYKPEDYTDGPILVVCHGVLRNAEEYRTHAKGMADRFHMLVVAPKFAEPAFPKERYQFGGVAVNGQSKPKEHWSGSFVPPIIAEVRRREGHPKLAYYCIGHSGGGQFLARLAGFVDNEAKSVVAANAGTHLFPTRDLPYPFGFGGLPEELSSDAVLKRYVAQPLVFFQGTDDLERDEYFDVTPPAEKQGRTRFERGRNVFAAGQQLAKEKGWKFGWRRVEAEGVGHDHEKMFDHPRCRAALLNDAP
ncbi:MAG: hypothetical protein IT428_24220 [Planctomycetaceae bacterium]|nr:hypothetical protein [Planctomycetaceae bacterium]